MTYLELVQRVCKRIGYTEPVSIATADKDGVLVAEWVSDSWVDIQLSCLQYDFMIERVDDVTLAVGKATYTKSELALPLLSHWLDINTVLYDDGTTDIIHGLTVTSQEEIDYDILYDDNANKPILFAFESNGNLTVYPKPDMVYSFGGSYLVTPVVLTDDNDTPACNVEHHMTIYHLALQKYSVQDSDPELMQSSTLEFEKRINRLDMTHCPQVEMGGRSWANGC
ncbi:MAG: hypothetical protein KZQ81_14300 [Candidatus Thiodiazotropha sp. (ex Rostrolucina anterorostrata)]|nr:hypothetical protein [Candidatus Thiodiazotropha sp. (ex Rostrolucina anterorostrata)]